MASQHRPPSPPNTGEDDDDDELKLSDNLVHALAAIHICQNGLQLEP